MTTMLVTNLYGTLMDIIANPYKGFIASFTGLSVSTAPSYIGEVSGYQTPNFIMNLQTIGLVLTIILATLSIVKVSWDLVNRVRNKVNNKKR